MTLKTIKKTVHVDITVVAGQSTHKKVNFLMSKKEKMSCFFAEKCTPNRVNS